jgi:hypothetical protein
MQVIPFPHRPRAISRISEDHAPSANHFEELFSHINSYPNAKTPDYAHYIEPNGHVRFWLGARIDLILDSHDKIKTLDAKERANPNGWRAAIPRFSEPNDPVIYDLAQFILEHGKTTFVHDIAGDILVERYLSEGAIVAKTPPSFLPK